MSIGAVLVGIGAFAVVAAYVARPFRRGTRTADLDRAIETWVVQVRERETVGADGETVSFCPRCDRRVAADDRFCSGCGERLRGGSR